MSGSDPVTALPELGQAPAIIPGPELQAPAIIPPPVPLSPLLIGYDHLILDLDGCVYVGDQVVPGAPAALSALRQSGKRLVFVTNDARRSPEEYVRKLWGLGIQAALEDVVTAGSAIQHVLAERFSRAATYVIGSPAVFRHVVDSGQHVVNGTAEEGRAEVVVIAGHDELRFDHLRAATQAVLNGAEMLGSCRDRTFPAADGPWPGTGAILAALEYATGQRASIVGKPDPQVFRTALDRLGPGQTLVVGDRIDVDLAGAAAAGLDGAIVLSGISTASEAAAARDPCPAAVADTLRTLVLG